MIYYINIFLEIVVGAIILYGVHDNSALFSQKAMALTRKKNILYIFRRFMDAYFWSAKFVRWF